MNEGCRNIQRDCKSALGDDTKKCGGADNSDDGKGSASNVTTTTTMTHNNAPMEYMGGQRVVYDDYLLTAVNHLPGTLMLLRCYLEGIHPQ